MNKIHEVCKQCNDTGEYATTIINHKGESRQTTISCQGCCEHGDYDHGICGICYKDCYEDLVGQSESAYEGDR